MIAFTLHPILGSGALQFAFEKATTEGKITIGSLIIVSLFSWTVILTKAWQLTRARRVAKKFFEAYRVTRDPLELARKQTDFDGAPAFELYSAGVQELSYQLENNPVDVRGQNRISSTSFTSVKAALERTAAEQALSLEKGMIVLSTAVAGGPFIGLLGTVWGVMEAFSSVATQQTAGIQQLAPGVSGAMLATIAGLVVAIPSVFGYNLLLGHTRRMITELENFASSLADRIELESD